MQAPKPEAAADRLGTLDMTGRISEVAVVLHARTCRPRLRVSAVALRSMLIAGHAQHLGLILRPMHDTLQQGCLHVDPVDPQAGMLRTMRFGSTAKLLAECKLKYYRISECSAFLAVSLPDPIW